MRYLRSTKGQTGPQRTSATIHPFLGRVLQIHCQKMDERERKREKEKKVKNEREKEIRRKRVKERTWRKRLRNKWSVIPAFVSQMDLAIFPRSYLFFFWGEAFSVKYRTQNEMGEPKGALIGQQSMVTKLCYHENCLIRVQKRSICCPLIGSCVIIRRLCRHKFV